MTKGELIVLVVSLANIKSMKGIKFNYTIAKNINLLKGEYESIMKGNEQSEGYKEYDKKRLEILEKYSKKDDNNKSVIVVDRGLANYAIAKEKQTEYKEEIEKLQKEHKKAIDEREKQVKEFQKFLKEDVKVKLFKVKLKEVPEDITTEQMTSIFDIIEE